MPGDAIEHEQVDHVDDAHRELGQLLAQDLRRRERLDRRHVASGGEDDVRPLWVTIPGPWPDGSSGVVVGDRLIHREPLRQRLLCGDDEVDIADGAQTVVEGRDEAVRIGWQVDADDRALLGQQRVDEPRPLVRVPVVILAPGIRGQEIGERGNRLSPRRFGGHLQPFAVLIGHRIDDRHEGFVAGKESVAAGLEVALAASPDRCARSGSPSPGRSARGAASFAAAASTGQA